ncbi:MAG: crossover junction endodeoxyribonuclease RuvC [Myxococcota bacterium]
MRILGVDPGSAATGYGVIERRSGGLAHVAHGTLRPRRGESLPLRLATLQRSLEEVIELHRPDVVSVERVFVAASARSALVLGHARGVILAAAARARLAVAEYAPREIKQAVAGTGAAQKAQVQAMVGRLLGLDRRPGQDAADALAAAICHAHAGRLRALGVGRSRRPRARRASALVVRRSR